VQFARAWGYGTRFFDPGEIRALPPRRVGGEERIRGVYNVYSRVLNVVDITD
jgi:hypothetical protein